MDVGMNCACFVNLSTITRIALKPPTLGSPVIKSNQMQSIVRSCRDWLRDEVAVLCEVTELDFLTDITRVAESTEIGLHPLPIELQAKFIPKLFWS
jgi:hypothetical protein